MLLSAESLHGAPAYLELLQVRTAEEAHAAAVARGALCSVCPLCGCGRGPVLGRVVPGAILAVVGETPGAEEVRQGVNFIGASGRELERGLRAGGFDRAEVTIVNAAACRPPGDNYKRLVTRVQRAHRKACDAARAAAAGQKPIYPPKPVLPHEACLPRLARDLVGTRTILALGGTALKSLAKLFGIAGPGSRAEPNQARLAVISKQRGAPLPLPEKGVTICSALHPAAALRDPRFLPVVRDDIRKACNIARRQGRIEWIKPRYVIEPTPDVAVGLLDALRAATAAAPVMVDIETDSKHSHLARIRCVGVGQAPGAGRAEAVGAIPLRRMNGSDYWSTGYGYAAKVRVANALFTLLNTAPLAFQNGVYDTEVLLRVGLISEANRKRLWEDTILGHHDSDWSELPHDLGFIAGQLFEAPHHKDDADAKAVGNVDDRQLWTYCCDDVLTQMRALPILRQRTLASGMERAYQIDRSLAPIARDMGNLGLIYDQHERFRLFWIQHAARTRLLAHLREVIGRPDFNPQSTVHVRDWLYGDCQLVPPLATDGERWTAEADPEDASTGEAALQTLLNQGCTEHVADGIESLIQHRAAAKLIGTYFQLEVLDTEEAVEAERAGRAVYRVTDPEGRSALVAEAPTSLVRLEDWSAQGYGVLSILHPSYKIHVVPAGRFAATPNVLAWPREIRSIIRAAPGHVLTAADAEQIELRFFAVASEDEKLIQAFRTGLDVHLWNFASMITGSTAEKAIRVEYERMKAAGGKKNPEIDHLRTIAKRFVYEITYGGEVQTLHDTMCTERRADGRLAFPGLQFKEVVSWHGAWHANHPETRRYFERLRHEHERRRYVESLVHGRRLFMIGGFDRNAAANFPQQSSTADVMNDALLEIAAACPHRGWSPLSGPILQVHDSIVLQVPEARADEALALLQRTMTRQIKGMDFPVALKKPGLRWSEV